MGSDDKVRAGSEGKFLLPYNADGFAWTDDRLGKFKFRCVDPKEYRQVADIFAWNGEFERNDLIVEITTQSGPKSPLKIIKDANLQIRSEALKVRGRPFAHWKHFSNVAAIDQTNSVCEPRHRVLSRLLRPWKAILRHPNSPSCPPVKD